MATTTAPATREKFLVFDGDCPMCQSTVGLLLRTKLVRREQTRSNHELEGADLATAQASGIRNQLVVIDPETRETRSGSDGLLWIIGDNLGNPLWLRLLRLPGPRHVVRWGYQSISYNRRIISPPRHQIVCDCEPEVTVARRLSLVVPVATLGISLLAGFGAAAFRGFELGSPVEGAALMLASIGGCAVTLSLAAGALLPSGKRLDYAAHLVVTLFVGSLVVLPAGLLALVLPRGAAISAMCVIAAVSIGLMFAMQRRRVKALAISRGWLVAWLAALVISLGATSFWYFGA